MTKRCVRRPGSFVPLGNETSSQMIPFWAAASCAVPGASGVLMIGEISSSPA